MKTEELHSLVKLRFQKSQFPEPAFGNDDLARIERHFECSMPESFGAFRALIGIYRIEGEHLPYEEMVAVAVAEKSANSLWEDDFIPFFALGNGDYLCLRRSECPESKVYFVPHDEPKISTLHRTFDEYLSDAEWFD